MKRLIALLLCFTCCLAFTACGGESVEPAKTIIVGKIRVNLPEGWLETLNEDQTSFSFKDNGQNDLGKLFISTKAVEEPTAVTDLKEVQPAKDGEGFKQPIKIITGTAQDGSAVTEYHLIHAKRDYAFVFTNKVDDATIRWILDSIDPF